MGCQTEIASIIHDAEAGYVLAVKDNQPSTHQAVEEFFLQRHEQQDYGPFGKKRNIVI
jgi:predicted transposase YbfD/YdcC